MALKKQLPTKALPKKKGKSASGSKKQAQKLPKSSPKQQSQLKTLFTSKKFKKSPVQAQTQSQVWRRTIVRSKPKQKVQLPRLFRTDRRTGLPVDYERTVEQVMHYVNPYIHSQAKRTPEQELEELMTNMFVELMQQGGAQELRSMLQKGCKGRGSCDWQMGGQCERQMGGQCDWQMGRKFPMNPRNDGRQENSDLSAFYNACKRGPQRTPSTLAAPTRRSRFNYNQLKIRSN
ncbi:uncharacterized protein LOC117581908 [Drosophila guanche]|uniref:Uncharacterized protein n=1 Tax=Drosophila guanche TaxID=7266 RepID=A0A3B0K0F7_DROGU|nr:uncharacterized protein LOC117581908 [Drosophila guanche]SPP79096.1 Hypothetical predicted protein [Drosophila guanche]